MLTTGRRADLLDIGRHISRNALGLTMLAQFEIASESFNKARKVWVQPAPAGKVKDCLIFLDAEFYIENMQAPTIVANLQAAGDLPPVTSIYLSYVDFVARANDCTCNHTFASFVATDLRRWIEQTAGRFERIVLCGLSLSGLAATFAALQHPTTFWGVLTQSPSAWWDDESLAHSLTPESRIDSRVWISVGDQESQENVMHSRDGLFQRASQRDSVRRLAEKLERLCREIHYEEFSGGHDMACWAEELPRALPWLMRQTLD
jgi:enterochelin esterase-like enzyme